MNRADILEAFHRGDVCKDCKDDCNKELPTTRAWSTIHHVTSPLRHTKGGMERLYRPCDNTGTHLWGDDVSLWNHGPTG